MKKLITALCILSVTTPALARKSCEELKTEIEEKMKAKGVVNFTLTIVKNEDVKDQKVVGSCDGGTQKITYVRK